MTTWIYTRTDELQHHGIKGQRWGVRRFQNKDGSLTPAGRRRYDDGDGREKSNNYERVQVGGQTFKVYGKRPENKAYAKRASELGKKSVDDIKKSVKNERNNKVDKNANIEKRYKIPKEKSLHRLQLEEKYRKNGLSFDEAEQLAAKRIRTEKFVAAAAAITATAAIATAKYKGYTKEYIFKEGSEFQRIMRLSENAEIKEGRQYLAFDKKDKVKYKGILADTFQKAINAEADVMGDIDPNYVKDKIYDVTVKSKQEIKVASEKMARDTFEKLYKEDMQFRAAFRRSLKKEGMMFALGKPDLQRIVNKVDNGKELNILDMKSKGYDLFNVMLMNKSEDGIKTSTKFYDALRKQGVNALQDVNDKKYSGYKSKMPIITIDGSYDYTKRVMESAEIASNNKKAWTSILVPQILSTGAIWTGYYGATPVMNKMNIEKVVLNYTAEHPNTKMTDAEIRAMVKEQMNKEDE